MTIPLDLPFEPLKQVALELENLATAEAGHVDVIAMRAALIKMLLSLQVHEVEFVHEAVALEKIQSSIDGHAVNLGIKSPRFAEYLDGVEMLLGSLDHAEDSAALAGHAQAARHQYGLQAPGRLGLRKWHRNVETQLQLYDGSRSVKSRKNARPFQNPGGR